MEDNGVFKQFGLEIYNTYEHSGLRAFPYMPFDDAIGIATKRVEQKPSLSGWYDKDACPKCKSKHVDCNEKKKLCVDCGERWL